MAHSLDGWVVLYDGILLEFNKNIPDIQIFSIINRP